MNHKIRKSIFGYCYEINLPNHLLHIKEELIYYPDLTHFQNNEKVVIIEFVNNINKEGLLSQNPKNLGVYIDGFVNSYGDVEVRWFLDSLKKNKIKISIALNKFTKLMNVYQKFRSLDYKTTLQNFGQFLHENVFVPSSFIFGDKVIMHGSTLYNKISKKSLLLGGTGGVGKTSTLLALSNSKDWIFLSDDIIVIDNNSIIYPNYSYPKIYAYNTINNKILKRLVLQKKSILDKLHWKIRSNINPSKVRARVNPSHFHNIEYINPHLNYNLFIFRSSVSEITHLQEINSNKAAELEFNIINSEYKSFFDLINLYEYNANSLKIKKLLSLSEIQSRLWQNYLKIFKINKNYLFHQNINISLFDFKNYILMEIDLLMKF